MLTVYPVHPECADMGIHMVCHEHANTHSNTHTHACTHTHTLSHSLHLFSQSTKAPSFRPRPLPAPSEYQVQFSWKSGPDAPLLQAEERLRRNKGAEGEIENGGGGTTKMRNASTVETKSNGVTSSHKKEQPKINGTQGQNL